MILLNIYKCTLKLWSKQCGNNRYSCQKHTIPSTPKSFEINIDEHFVSNFRMVKLFKIRIDKVLRFVQIRCLHLINTSLISAIKVDQKLCALPRITTIYQCQKKTFSDAILSGFKIWILSFWVGVLQRSRHLPAQINNRNTRTRCEICSKLTIKTPDRSQQHRSGVFIVNFEQISFLALLFILFWAGKCRLGGGLI